ncbi:MAG TPA: alkaline phosphatase family protein [Acidimicrobiia bacterium]|nr:alkaline phosphatase family protein [Acidimicrobiia bacterium]
MTDPRQNRFDRRELLRGAAVLGAAAAFGACSSSSGKRAVATRLTSPSTTALPTTTVPRRPRRPGDRPDPSKPAGVDMLPKIEHIVVLMMENHSFDNYLGVLGRGDGLPLDAAGKPLPALPDGTGHYIHSFPMPTTCQLKALPSQAWQASHLSLGNGDNSGFVKACGPVAMGYFTPDDIPFYAGLARTYPLSDRWFASCLAQTYPNRRFLMAGSAAGVIDTTAASVVAPPPPNGVIMERLEAHGLSWMSYYVDISASFLFPSFMTTRLNHTAHIERFYQDAKNGTLPALSYVDPAFDDRYGESEENPADIRVGEQFAAKVVHAVTTGKAWDKTVLIWLYDEHGGYYDHVVPPRAIAPDSIPPNLPPGAIKAGYDQYGFRVPAAIISPYAKKHYVSHVVHDHTSILKLIETKWNLPALTFRDANADDLLDSLDFENPPAFAEPPELPEPALGLNGPPPATVDCGGVGAGAIPPPGARTTTP